VSYSNNTVRKHPCCVICNLKNCNLEKSEKTPSIVSLAGKRPISMVISRDATVDSTVAESADGTALLDSPAACNLVVERVVRQQQYAICHHVSDHNGV